MTNKVDILRKIHRNKITGNILRFISNKTGENIYNRSQEWDILLIIDAATYKIISELKDEYDYITEVDRIVSRGSNSPGWVENTFINDYEKYKKEINKTHYITGNIYSSFVLSGIPEKHFFNNNGYDRNKSEMYMKKLKENKNKKPKDNLKNLHSVWNQTFNLDDPDGEGSFFIPPEPISQKLIETINNKPIKENNEKIIAHYMQPHEPFVEHRGEKADEWPNTKENQSMLNMNEKFYQKLKQNYKDNHKYILNHIEKLLLKIPQKYNIRITSDHGNIIGKIKNINYAFGHPQYITFSSSLRKVPWIKINQSNINKTKLNTNLTEFDNKTKEKEKENISGTETIKRLEDLGYK